MLELGDLVLVFDLGDATAWVQVGVAIVGIGAAIYVPARQQYLKDRADARDRREKARALALMIFRELYGLPKFAMEIRKERHLSQLKIPMPMAAGFIEQLYLLDDDGRDKVFALLTTISEHNQQIDLHLEQSRTLSDTAPEQFARSRLEIIAGMADKVVRWAAQHVPPTAPTINHH